MANQINLDKLWASSGGITDTGDVKYDTGWVEEIPTYQNFNFLLNALDNNVLYLAENGNFDWQPEINYNVGARVVDAGYTYSCLADNIGEKPSTDTHNSYWTLGVAIGKTAPRFASRCSQQQKPKHIVGQPRCNC